MARPLMCELAGCSFTCETYAEMTRHLKEHEIDSAFERMGRDEKYQRTSRQICEEFAQSDWEALRISEGEDTQP